MTRKEIEIKMKSLIKTIQTSSDNEEVAGAMSEILEQFKPFRKALATKFTNKGVSFEDICQQIDLMMIEAMCDYDELKDPSAIRHVTSKARNGLWNYYRKEMDYFNEDRKFISLDSLSISIHKNGTVEETSLLETLGISSNEFDEEDIVNKIILGQEIDQLTEHQKDILTMYYLVDMTQEEIAEELQIHQTNVSRATKRGIKRLKETLNPEDETYDKQN